MAKTKRPSRDPMRYSVHEDDRIWFRIPFTVYWIGKEGGDYHGLCLYRKQWDVKLSEYFWESI